MSVCTWVEARGHLWGLIPLVLPNLFLDTVSFACPELADYAGQAISPGIPLLLPPQYWDYRRTLPHPTSVR